MVEQVVTNPVQWYTQDPWKAYMSWFSPRWAQPIEDFDPAEWVEKLKRGGFRIAVLHCKHHDGICFFESKYREKQPKRDYIAEFTAEAHQQGLRVMAYYSVTIDVWSAEVHPDWRCVDREGMAHEFGAPYPVDHGVCCVNNPGFRALILGQMEEILETAEPDGFWLDSMEYPRDGCFCDYCRQAFADTHGGADLAEAWGTDQTRRWSRDYLLDLMRSIREIADRGGVRRPLVYNGCGSNLLPGFDEIDALCDSLSAEADAPETKSFAPRFLAPRKKPEHNFEHYTPVSDSVNSWTTRPTNMLLSEAALLTAHGGSVVGGFDVTPGGFFSGHQMDELGQVGAFLRERQEYVINTEPVYDVGLLIPFAREYNPAWPLTLLRHHVPFGVVLPDRIDIDRYRLLIVEDGFPLENATLDALETFVSGGGSLLVDGRVLSAHPPQRLMNLLGLSGATGTGFSTNYVGDLHGDVIGEMSREPVRSDGAAWKLELADAESLARYVYPIAERSRETYIWWGPNPPRPAPSSDVAITRNRVGNGSAVCMGYPIAEADQPESRHRHRLVLMVENLIHLLIEEPLLRSEAPSGVEVIVNRQGNRHIVHFVNRYPILTGLNDRPGNLPSLANVTVWINENRVGKVRRILRAPRDREIGLERNGSWVRLRAKELAIQESFILEHSN